MTLTKPDLNEAISALQYRLEHLSPAMREEHPEYAPWLQTVIDKFERIVAADEYRITIIQNTIETHNRLGIPLPEGYKLSSEEII